MELWRFGKETDLKPSSPAAVVNENCWRLTTIPVIEIGFAHDPWDGNYRRTCAIRFGGREGASEVLLPGSGHDTSQSREAQRAVLDFLRAHTRT